MVEVPERAPSEYCLVGLNTRAVPANNVGWDITTVPPPAGAPHLQDALDQRVHLLPTGML